MLNTFAILLVVTTFYHSNSQETKTASPKQIGSTSDSLPQCFDSEAQIAELKDSIAANKKKPTKYRYYRNLLKGESIEVLMARLVYAETLAAKCPIHNTAMVPNIATVIANRLNKRAPNTSSDKEKKQKDTLFERDQFASSLNIYKYSEYKAFLCPTNTELWSLALKSTQDALNNPPSDKWKNTFHYYFYEHTKNLAENDKVLQQPIKPNGPPAPDWTRVYAENTTDTNPERQQCVRFFDNSKWK